MDPVAQFNYNLAAVVILQCVAAIGLCVAHLTIDNNNGRIVRRRFGVHPINQLREELGDYNNLYWELRLDPRRFFNYTRMSLAQFDLLLAIVEDDLTLNSRYAKPHPAPLRLLVTLRFLATGDNIQSLAYAYRIGRSTLTDIINATNRVLWRNLHETFLAPPSADRYAEIAQDFENRWNLPLCLGAIDGKHVVIMAPPHSGSNYMSYKKTFSVVLMAVCDANYCFTLVDVGHIGSLHDAGIFADSNFGKKILQQKVGVPAPRPLPGMEEAARRMPPGTQGAHMPDCSPTPHFFVGDEAFPLRENLMRPYPKAQVHGNSDQAIQNKIFNYRLSRGRRIIENTFGILAAKWRIYHKTIQASHNNAVSIVKATLVLHNFILMTKDNHVTFGNFHAAYGPDKEEGMTREVVEGAWRKHVMGTEFRPTPPPQARNPTAAAKAIRNRLGVYFKTVGRVPWQMDHVLRGQF